MIHERHHSYGMGDSSYSRRRIVLWWVLVPKARQLERVLSCHDGNRRSSAGKFLTDLVEVVPGETISRFSSVVREAGTRALARARLETSPVLKRAIEETIPRLEQVPDLVWNEIKPLITKIGAGRGVPLEGPFGVQKAFKIGGEFFRASQLDDLLTYLDFFRRIR